MAPPPPLVDIRFTARLFEWRGPAPFHFLAVPEAHVGEIAWAARSASYGWGMVPVAATIGDVDFTTAMYARDGTYLLPVKNAVRRRAGIAPGDAVDVRLIVRPRR